MTHADAEGALVLVAEDDEGMRMLLRERLTREGFRVETAHDGQEALNRLAELHPHLLIADLRMPRMDGAALCRAVRADERTRTLPILILSAVEESSEVGELVALGKVYYISKTAEWERTRRTIRNLLGVPVAEAV